MKNSNRQGFTLVEMSIVIVIVGLLIGILLEGQEMIQSARVKATVTQWEKAKVSVATFYKKFNAMPGDYDEAQRKIDASLVNGDGDGEINNNDGGEYLNVWEHLTRAGMISNIEKYDDSSITRSRYRGEIRGSEFFMFYGVPNKTATSSSNTVPQTTNVASVSLPSYSLEVIEDVLWAHDYSICESEGSGYYNTDVCECQRAGGMIDNSIFNNPSSYTTVQDVLDNNCYVCNILTSVVSVAKGTSGSDWKTETNTKAYLNGCNVCSMTSNTNFDPRRDALKYDYTEKDTGRRYYENDWFLEFCADEYCDYYAVFGDREEFLTKCDICDPKTAANGDGIQLSRWSEFESLLSGGGFDNLYRRCDLCVYDASYADDSWFKDNCVCKEPALAIGYEDDYGKSNLYQNICGYCEPSKIKNYRNTILATDPNKDLYDAERCDICGGSDQQKKDYYDALGDVYISECTVCTDPSTYISLIGEDEFFNKCGVCDASKIKGFDTSLSSLGIDVYDKCVCVHSAADVDTFNGYIGAIPDVDVYEKCGGCEPSIDKYSLYENTTNYKDKCVCQYGTVESFESIIGEDVYSECGYCDAGEIDTAEDNITPIVDLYAKCVCSVAQIEGYIDGSGGSLVDEDVFEECSVCSDYAKYGDISGFDAKCTCADPDETYSYESAYNSGGKNVYDVCGYCDVGEITGKENLSDGSGGTIDIYDKCDVCLPKNISDYIHITKASSGTTVVADCQVCNNPGTYGDEIGWDVFTTYCGDVCDDPGTYLYTGTGPSPNTSQLSWVYYEDLCSVCDNKSKYAPDYADSDHLIADFYSLCGECEVAYAAEWGGMGSKQAYLDACVCKQSTIDIIELYVDKVPETLGGDNVVIYGSDGCDICNLSNAEVYVNDDDFKATFIDFCDPCESEYDTYVGEDWFDSVCSPCDAKYYGSNYANFMSICDPCDTTTSDKYEKYGGETWFETECSPCANANIAKYAQFNTNMYQECGVCDADGMQSRYSVSIPNATDSGYINILELCSVCDNPSIYYGSGLEKSTFESVCEVCNKENIEYYWDKLDVDAICNYCDNYEKYGVPYDSFYKNHCVDCKSTDCTSGGDNFNQPWFERYCDICDLDNLLELLKKKCVTQAEYESCSGDSICDDPTYQDEAWWQALCGDFCDIDVHPLTDLISIADANSQSISDNVVKDCGYCNSDIASNYKEDWFAKYCDDPCSDEAKMTEYMGKYYDNMYEFCGWCDDKSQAWDSEDKLFTSWYISYCEDPCDLLNIDSYLSVYPKIYEKCELCKAEYKGEAWMSPGSTVCDYCKIIGIKNDIPNCDPCYDDPNGLDADGDQCDYCTYRPNDEICAPSGPVTVPEETISVPDPCEGSTAPACLADYDDKHHFMHLMKWQQSRPSTMNSLDYVLTGEEAFEIDRKFDDGDYETGGIMIVCPKYTAKDGANGDEIFSPLGQKRACYTSMRMDN